MRSFLALAWLLPALALAAGDPAIADLETTWSAVTTDDTGAALPAPVAEYRVYACGSAEPLAVVAGDVLGYIEPDVVTGTGTHCREVAAYLAPFEGPRGQGTVVVVMPGTPNISLQALP